MFRGSLEVSGHVETLNLLSMVKNENRSCIISGKVLPVWLVKVSYVLVQCMGGM